MGQQSQSGQIGVKTQADKGTYADPGDSGGDNGIFLPIRGGGLGGNRELLIPDPEIGGHRDIPRAYLGPIAYSGEYEIYPRLDSFATFLVAAFGNVSSSDNDIDPMDPLDPADIVGTHTITPAGSALPWLSIEEAIGDDYECFNYTDCRVNSIHLEADADGYLMGTVGLIALKQEAGKTRTVAPPLWDTSPLIVGTNITVTLGGTNLKPKSFSFDFNNNIEDDDFRLGSLTLGDLVPKRRELTVGLTIRPEDKDLWRTAMYGSSSATEPGGGEAAMSQVVITMATYEEIGESTKPWELVITIPKMAITPFNLEPSGDDVIEHDLELQALRPAAGTPLATAVLKNNYKDPF